MRAAQQLNPGQAVIYGDRGATCSAGLSFDQWSGEIKGLQTRYRATQWQIGDLMLFGRPRYGEDIWQAIDLDFNTITRYEKLAGIFPEKRRRACGISLHQAVEKLTPDEQDELLDLAIKRGWTREALREEIKARKNPNDTGEPVPENTEPVPEQEPEAESDGELPPLYRANADGELTLVEDTASERPALRLVTTEEDPEPAPDLDPLSATEAALMLRSAASAGYLPKEICAAIITVLDDREQLMRQMAVRERRDAAQDLLE